MKTPEYIHKLTGTFFGVGYVKFAPGTAGSLVAILLIGFLNLSTPLSALFIAVLFFAGVKSADFLEKIYEKDAGCIVIDEVVGMWISVLFLPRELVFFVAAFVIFRFFDITKVLYIKKAERLGGGLGVMADDVLAGIYTNLLIQLFIHFR